MTIIDELMKLCKAEPDDVPCSNYEAAEMAVPVIKDLLSQIEESQWKPIEGAPKDGLVWVLVTNDPWFRQEYAYVERAVYAPELGGWWNKSVEAANCDTLHEPTHWMPLPKAPEETLS